FVDTGSGGPLPNLPDLTGAPTWMADGDPGVRATALVKPDQSSSSPPKPLPGKWRRAIPFGLAEWTVTMRRALLTVDPAHDVQFVPDGVTPHYFQVATFDNETGKAQDVGMTDGATETYSVIVPAPDGLPGLQDLIIPSLPPKLTSLTGTYDDNATPGDLG